MNPAQGWNGTNKIFKELIAKYRPSVIVEVGSWHGQSAITMALACKELGLNTKIYCIDTWLGALEFHTVKTPDRDLMMRDGYPQVYYKFLENIRVAGVADMIEAVPLPSRLGLKLMAIRGVKPDLIYIDGSHEFEDVVEDLTAAQNLRPKLIFGDDYGNGGFPGVKKAADMFNAKVYEDGWFWIVEVV